MKNASNWPLAAAFYFLVTALPAQAFDFSDPFGRTSAVAAAPAKDLPCNFAPTLAKLTLLDVVDRALCNNPQTRAAWANARAQSEQVGVAQSAYLPTLTANGSETRNRTTSGVVGINRVGAAGNSVSFTQKSYGFSLAYTLYDFGARSAQLQNAESVLTALNETQDFTLQSVFLSAVQAYYQLLTADALVDSSRTAEKSADEGYAAARLRHRLGTATLADELQAKTARAQAIVNLTKAEGDDEIARGTLLNAMGLDASGEFSLASPPSADPGASFKAKVEALIEEAKMKRPDLLAAKAQVDAARAQVDAAKATGLPVVSLSAGRNWSSTTFTSQSRNDSLGVSLSVPLFTGFNTLSRVRAAQAQVESQAAAEARISQQVALDVWRAYHNLDTQSQTLTGSRDQVESAEAAERLTMGRYKAGLGNILDLLNAQSALATARSQYIQAQYNWRIAKAALAQSMGELGLSNLDKVNGQ